MGGGAKGRFVFFRKSNCFGTVTHPLGIYLKKWKYINHLNQHADNLSSKDANTHILEIDFTGHARKKHARIFYRS